MASSTTYAVQGMTCAHCVATLRTSLLTLSGVRDVSVKLVPGGDSSVSVESTEPPNRSAVRSAIAKAGFVLR